MLCRHGEYEGVDSGQMAGESDPPLNSVGRETAMLVADQLSTWSSVTSVRTEALARANCAELHAPQQKRGSQRTCGVLQNGVLSDCPRAVPHFPRAQVMCSPMTRCVATAEIVADTVECTPTVNTLLRPMDRGDWERLTPEQVPAESRRIAHPRELHRGAGYRYSYPHGRK